MAEIARISISCDKELTDGAEAIFNELGISTNAAIKLFLQAVIREQGIPFRLDVRSSGPDMNERMM